MNCKEFEKLLSIYLENSISDENRVKIEMHLRSCSLCRELLNSLKEIKETLSEFPKLKVKEELIQKILNNTLPKRREIFLFPHLQPIFAYLVAFLILIFSYLFIPNKNKIFIEVNKHLHLAYSQVEKLLVKGESFKEHLIGYKENLEEKLKEKKLQIFNFNEYEKEEKNGGKEG